MNRNQLKQLLKKNKYIDALSRIIAYPVFAIQYKKSDYAAERRKNGFEDKEYMWLKKYHNIKSGDRCFIVATGPSLTMDDLNLIKGEYSFGMNSVIKAFDKTDWRPDFYMIQDEYVYDKLEAELQDVNKNENFLIAVGGAIPDRYESAKNYKRFSLHYLDHKMFHRSGFGEFKYSNDCYSVIYDAYTVTFSVLQMACYMGFREICLLGCDCNYNQSKAHFADYGHHDPKAAVMGDKMLQGHYEFKKFADSIGVKIVNCTRGGMLEAYPRITLETVLKEKKCENSSCCANETE